MVSLRQHLAQKLKPVFTMLNKIEGVSESDALLKQGGEVKAKGQPKKTEKPKKITSDPTGENKQKTKSNPKDQKDNEAFVSRGK